MSRKGPAAVAFFSLLLAIGSATMGFMPGLVAGVALALATAIGAALTVRGAAEVRRINRVVGAWRAAGGDVVLGRRGRTSLAIGETETGHQGIVSVTSELVSLFELGDALKLAPALSQIRRRWQTQWGLDFHEDGVTFELGDPPPNRRDFQDLMTLLDGYLADGAQAAAMAQLRSLPDDVRLGCAAHAVRLAPELAEAAVAAVLDGPDPAFAQGLLRELPAVSAGTLDRIEDPELLMDLLARLEPADLEVRLLALLDGPTCSRAIARLGEVGAEDSLAPLRRHLGGPHQAAAQHALAQIHTRLGTPSTGGLSVVEGGGLTVTDGPEPDKAGSRGQNSTVQDGNPVED